MKILLIGSGGFIGSNAYNYFSTNPCYQVQTCSLRDNPDFDALFGSSTFDFCLNASGAAHVPSSLEHPEIDFQLNVVNIFKLLSAMRKHNPACRFINLSSAAVYGNPQYSPVDEKHPIAPVSPYGYHKYQSELICKEFHQFYELPTCSLRIFSAYGPGLKKQLFWDLYQKTQLSENIQLFGTGRESRDFIYIEDLLKAIEAVMHHASFCGETINIANGSEVFIQEAVHTFLEALGQGNRVAFSGVGRAGDPVNWCADISLLQSYGYCPQVNINNGLHQYVKWLKEKR